MAEGQANLRVAVAGLGAIGTDVVKALDQGIEGLTLVAVPAHSPAKHRGWVAQLNSAPKLVPIVELADVADIVVECAPSKVVRSIVAPVVERGKTAVVLSVGALLQNGDLVDLAKAHGGQIIVPTGALIARCGDCRGDRDHSLGETGDAKAGREACSARRYLVENDIRIDDITEPLRIFEGSARDCQGAFRPISTSRWRCRSPASAYRTRVEIWADRR